jgi:hypothetical protein
VAFCPSPPLLLPEVEGRADADTTALRRACADAVAATLAAGPEVVLVVGQGAGPGERYGAGDVGDLRGLGLDLQPPFDRRGRPGGRRVPLPHTLGARLLDDAGYAGRRVGAGPADLGSLLRELPRPLGMLVMGDGSARRGARAPGYLDDAAAPFDAAVAGALGDGNPAALADLDPAEGDRLLAAGVPAWRAVGTALTGRPVRARLHLDAAPFGVGYLVADWVVG